MDNVYLLVENLVMQRMPASSTLSAEDILNSYLEDLGFDSMEKIDLLLWIESEAGILLELERIDGSKIKTPKDVIHLFSSSTQTLV